jgi:hypothetical protein
MRIELRDGNRRRIGRLEADAALRPTRVSVVPRNGAVAEQREVFLNWDTAVDDAGKIRRCIACGCSDLFREKAFPQVTGFVVILAFVGAIVGALGLATNMPVMLTMIAVLVLDIAILVFSKRRLVCYRCLTSYHELSIARYHHPWDRGTAERYPAPALAPPPAAPAPGEAAITTAGDNRAAEPVAQRKGSFA